MNKIWFAGFLMVGCHIVPPGNDAGAAEFTVRVPVHVEEMREGATVADVTCRAYSEPLNETIAKGRSILPVPVNSIVTIPLDLTRGADAQEAVGVECHLNFDGSPILSREDCESFGFDDPSMCPPPGYVSNAFSNGPIAETLPE